MSKLSDYFYFVYFYLIDSARCLDKVITKHLGHCDLLSQSH